MNERKLGKLVKINKTAQEFLKVSTTPLLIHPSLQTPISGDEIEIAKFIAQEAGRKPLGLKPIFFGETKEEIEKNDKFFSHIINDLKYDPESLIKELNKDLHFNTFIHGYQNATALDIFAFAVVAKTLGQMSNEQKNEFSNVFRWGDFIQNLKGIHGTVTELKISFSIPYEPFVLTACGDKKKKEKKEKKKEAHEGPKGEQKGEQKKEKKQKEPQKEVHLMSKVDIRVGKVVNVFPNPEGDKLYNEEIDVGNGEVRKIASGLRQHVKIEELKDSLVVVICNLQPRMLKGWESHGMILCASADGKVEPLRPPQGSQPGDLVHIGDLPREPVADKKCPWSKVCDDLITNDKKEATYKGELIWKTDKGIIASPNLAKAKIS